MQNIARTALAGLIAAALFATPALAQQKLKIGFITTSRAAGRDRQRHAQLGRARARSPRRKVGGLETEIIYGDDQVKPDVGKQVAEEMLKKHQVNFVSGVIWSNVMLAVAPP
jgi:branched-chain amino acid transport system substrate-binding protein